MLKLPLLQALNVRVVGSGEKVLVLAHGFGTDQSAWQRILPYFLPFYRVVLFDLACAGTVDPESFEFCRYANMDAYVDDLLGILDALLVTRCFYVGHSVSGMIGIMASIRRPDLFAKLILIGASPDAASPEATDVISGLPWLLLLLVENGDSSCSSEGVEKEPRSDRRKEVKR